MCKRLILLAVFVCVLGLIGAAEAAFDTVGVYDPDDDPHHNQVDQSGVYDSHTGNAGPENVMDLATFQELIGPAFDADAGGVVDAEVANGSIDDGAIIANFGAGRTKSVTFTDTPGNLSWGDGSSSGNRLPTSGDGRFSKAASPPDWVFDIGPVTGGVQGEVVTHFAGTLLYRDNRELNPQVTATFSGGGAVTAIADMPESVTANSRDTFFGFVAPPGESIVNVNFDLAAWTNLDDVAFITSAFSLKPELASEPDPATGATDLPRDIVLSWKPGEDATGHDVYLGTDYNDVSNAGKNAPLGVLVGPNHDANDFAPAAVLSLGQTYYWRVDEISGANTFKGELWEFTIEPVGYPIANITATASSSNQDQGPENTVNGSGLSDDLHSKVTDTMWLSGFGGPQPTWIQFEFDKVYKLHEMWVWNSNTDFETSIGYGARDVLIEYSVDGIDYVTLGTTHEFSQAPGAPGYAHNTTVDFGGLPAKYVRVTVNSNWGGFLPQFGLSEVRFLHMPVRAREPQPDSGSTDVSVDVTLGWRAGRQAAEHNVYLSVDEQAVIDGAAPVTAVTETRYSPLPLDLDSVYYWRVDEVNNVAPHTTWQGDVWNLSTQEFLVVDDFESYNDTASGEPGSNLVYETWLDGYGTTTNGSTIGYTVAFQPTMELGVVHGGDKSAPMAYDNAAAAFSEVTRTLAPQNWTDHGIQTLSLWFYGDPANMPGQLYVKINGVRVNYPGDSANLGRPLWKQWNIELASVGANLQGVTGLTVGVEGFGAAGVLLLDSIALYKSVSELPVEVYLEAEAATPLGASWASYIDPASSGGQHIGSEDGVGNDNGAAPGPEWTAVYNFDIPVEGVYKVVLRAQENGSDSFWVRIVGATSQTHEDPAQPGTGWVRFNGMDAPDGWAWDEVHSNDHDNTVVNWTLAAGGHTLEIAKREDGVLLDAILITSDVE